MADTLKQRIIRQIKLSGPLPLAEYMHWCMADKKQGYYQTKNSIGGDGDFITAPEVSQMFGELIGIWALAAWTALGSPAKFNLVELGPGRGTLLKDIWRATQISKEFQTAARVILVETSEKLKELQRAALTEVPKKTWHAHVSELEPIPTILIANEFFDVLPFRQYVKAGSVWRENAVGLDEDGNLSWVLGENTIRLPELPATHHNEPEGAVFEISTPREVAANEIAELVSANHGAALIIDYGHTKTGFGDTFQAVENHAFVDPLTSPGTADLTSHVDFEALAGSIENLGLELHRFMNQGEFLLSLGLLERAGSFGHGKDSATQARIKSEAERLVLPDQMGELFKVFCFSSCSELPPFSNKA